MDDRIRVYGIGASRASRPLWMLEELGVPYELVRQDYKDKSTRSPAYLAINPNGRIPAIVDGDVVVWESMATTLYLARRFGGELAPANLAEEAEALRWSFWVMSECEKDALIVLFQRVVNPPDKRDEALAAAAESRLAVPLKVLDAHLATRAYLAGERFTVADLNVASVLSWIKPSKRLAGEFPVMSAWLDRCLARPAQQRVRAMARAG
ncbi:MAG: glutathione S-transferase family protein [Lautropia sp.]